MEQGRSRAAGRPRILIGQPDPSLADDRALAERKIALYQAAIVRAGGEPRGIDERADAAERGAAFAWMDGLLLTGGVDIDPAMYGAAVAGSRNIQRARDDLELAAFQVARDRGMPVLGVCRGLQAINAFAGGTLVQHLEGHAGPELGSGPVRTHPLSVVPGTRLESILGVADGESLIVNSYHHQAVTADGLAPGLVAAAHASHEMGPPLVEGLEAADPGRFLVGIQCHPERLESTPPEFERLFAAFVEASRR